MHDRPKKKTVDLCYHKQDDGSPCEEKVMWKLKSEENGRTFKVCDRHLAWGIRLSGYPAYVDVFNAEAPAETD